MLTDIVIRFVVGGVIVSLFSVLGDLVKPKSFAGIFGAAPSVALATIVLTVVKQGRVYVSVEARSMILGAIAFLVYACMVMRILRTGNGLRCQSRLRLCCFGLLRHSAYGWDFCDEASSKFFRSGPKSLV